MHGRHEIFSEYDFSVIGHISIFCLVKNKSILVENEQFKVSAHALSEKSRCKRARRYSLGARRDEWERETEEPCMSFGSAHTEPEAIERVDERGTRTRIESAMRAAQRGAATNLR